MRITLLSLASQAIACSFIQPFIGIENVGIHVLTAILRKAGHEVDVIDGVALELSLEQVQDRIRRFRPKVLGFSPTLAVMRETLALSVFARTLRPTPFVILGGHHATLTASAIIENEGDIDAIALGEADRTLPALVAALERGSDLASVPGLALRRDGRMLETGQAEMVADLDEIPLMARDTLVALQENHDLVAANIQAARGCPYSCAFCSTPTFYAGQTRYRRRSAEHVAEEMARVSDAHEVQLFNFTDDIFLVPSSASAQWAREFRRAIRGRGLNIAFAAMLRAEILRPAHADTIADLIAAGLHHVLIGIENATTSTLDFFDKRSSLADYQQAINFLREHRVFLACAFISLEPHTRPDDVRNNVRFLRDVAQDPILYHYISQLTVFPGTPIEASLGREGLLTPPPDAYKSGNPYRFVNPVIAMLAEEFSHLSTRPIAGDVTIDHLRFALGRARAAGQIDIEQYMETFDLLGAHSRRFAEAHAALIERCVRLAEARQQIDLRCELEAYAKSYAIASQETSDLISARIVEEIGGKATAYHGHGRPQTSRLLDRPGAFTCAARRLG